MSLIASALASDAATTATTTAAALPAQSALMNFAPLVLIFIVFYFLLIRPQMKKQKEHVAMINSITRGEKVVTGGGIIGTVHKVEEDGTLQVEIAPDVKVRVMKSSITDVLNRTQPSNSNVKEEGKKANK